MKKSSYLTRIVLIQHIGFLAIIVVCFLNELLQLPTLIFSGDAFAFVFQRSTLDMLLVLAVWFLVSRSTQRAMERIRYLEGFLRVCAWCRQIEYQSEWISLEKFMEKGFDTPTTHGICPACMACQKEAIARAKQARENRLESA